MKSPKGYFEVHVQLSWCSCAREGRYLMSALLVNKEEAPGCRERYGLGSSALPHRASPVEQQPAFPVEPLLSFAKGCSWSCSKPGRGGTTCAFGEETLPVIAVSNLLLLGSDGSG